MSDRRQPSDRRHLIPRIGGRRRTDFAPSHGTRARYQQGCPCIPCKAAEAVYRAQLRLRKVKGLPLLGALVSAVEARRRLMQLRKEGYPDVRIEQIGGWSRGALRLRRQDRIRLVTHLRMMTVADEACLEGTDAAADL